MLLFGNLNISLFKKTDVNDNSGMFKDFNVAQALDKSNFDITFLKIVFLSNFIFTFEYILFYSKNDDNINKIIPYIIFNFI